VCEASSFQLEDTEAFAPDAAVLLNLAEDHLDRHGTFEAYRAAKLEIFSHQPEGSLAVVPAALPLADAAGQATRVTFGQAGPADDGATLCDAAAFGEGSPDLAHRDGTLFWRGEPLIAASDIRLRGAHNRENAMAAAAVCLARGVDAAAVRDGLATFAGVPHRLEEVGIVDGVTYVNDSKATNVASAEVAIQSFDGGVHLIAGGRGKGSDYAPLAGPVRARCAGVYLIGETAAALHEALLGTGVALHDSTDLERAVTEARRHARPGDVVLLSPGCASFDQYRSYEERGDHFRGLVSRLA
jgi:UDP-N-acetylmuramoylalanine--D-glutamate ligase